MKRKAKTMAKILEEFPDARFDDHGNLHAGTAILYNASFNELGEFVEDALWCEQFLEPLPEKKEKKLYAYLDDGQVTFDVSDQYDYQTRAPEFDLIYPGIEE